MPDIDQLAALRERQELFLATIPAVDPTVPVPWCGRWRVRNLVEHLARVHHWAAAHARRRQETPLGRGPFDLVEFYGTNAEELRDAFAELDPDAPAWTLSDDGVPKQQRTGTVRFWHRRQALETLIHLWDLRTAAALDYEPGAAAWADCLDEVATVMHPRQIRLNRIGPPATRTRFVADDVQADHLLRESPGGSETVVSGPVRSLALLSWGRLPRTDSSLSVAGDVAALDATLAAGLTP